MKAVNFWKTLFCAAMAITAFTACSDDDDEGGFSGQPSITVNGEKSTAVAGKYAEGDTPAVDVVSTGKWTLTFDNADDAKWCTPKPASGNAGTTKLVFNLSSTNTDRQAVVTLITEGIIEGISIPAKATITVKQNKNGTTTVETNVKDIREEVTFAEITDNSKIQDAAGNQITESKVITGIVVSDYVGNNINNHQIMLTDNTTEAGAGLMIRFVGYVGNKATDHNLTCGSIVSFDLKNGYAKIFKGAYVVTFVGQDPTITIEDEQDNTPAAIEVTDPSKLIDYQSQYVKVYSQPTESYRGQNYYTNTGTTEKPSYYYYPIYQMKDGQTFKLTVSSYCSWATSLPIPAKAGSMLGCVSVYDSADLAPRNAADVAGMTEDLFEVTAAKTTISQITATGDYEIQGATVVATYQQGFVMQDNTGAILVFCGTEATLPAVGDVVTVTGTVAEYGDALQFDKGATVTKTGTATYTPSTPTDVTADNITGMMTAPKATYVKMTGKLSAGSFVNVDFLFDTNYTGSITSPNADLNVASFDGKIVDVEGWFVNNGAAKGNGKYFTVVATKIAENTTIANGTFTNSPTAFAATNPVAQTLNFTANAAAGTVTLELGGTNKDQFETSNITATSVTVNAKGNNTSVTAYTATLTLKAADGAVLDEVTLTQSAPTSGSGYAKIEKIADLKAGTGYLAGLVKGEYQTWNGEISTDAMCETVPYTYTESTGAFVAEKDAAVEISLVAVSGVANAYYIKYGEKYLTVSKAGKNTLTLADSAENNYWTFEDATDGMKGVAKAFDSWLLTSATAGSKNIRSYSTTATTKTGVIFFLAK